MNTRKILLAAAILLFYTIGVFAQDLRIVSDEKGNIGFASPEGEIVVKCKYTAALPFESGYARICQGNKWGIIDSTGREVLPLKFDEISAFEGEVTRVKSGDKYGLFGKNGAWVLPLSYSHISRFNVYGLAWFAKGQVKSDGKKTKIFNGDVGVVSKDGVIRVEPKYDGLAEFSPRPNDWMGYTTRAKILSYALGDTLRTDGTYYAYDTNCDGPLIMPGLIDGSTGKVLVKTGIYNKICRPIGGMMRFYRKPSKEGVVFGYHNLTTGNDIICPVLDKSGGREITHGDFVGDIALVVTGQEKTDKGGWQATEYVAIDRNGDPVRKNISRAEFCWRSDARSGYWALFERMPDGGEICEVTDEQGRGIFAERNYTDVKFPSFEGGVEELFCLKKEGRWGLVTREEQVLIPFEWDDICPPRHGMVSVCKEKRWGLLQTDGEVWVPVQYEAIASPGEETPSNVFVQTGDGAWRNLKVGESEPYSNLYREAGDFLDGFAWVCPVDFKAGETFLNKVQKVEDMDNVLGVIINGQDEEVVPFPVARKFSPLFFKVLSEQGGRLSRQQTRRMILSLTGHVRSSKMDSIVPSEEWDY